MRCELHEVDNCAYCNGDAHRLDRSLQEATVLDRGLPEGRSRVTIAAKFNGRCASCKEYYTAGTYITHSKQHDGWIGVDCCGYLAD